MFITVSFAVGSLAYYFKYKSELTEVKKYDYSKQDSLFLNNKNSSNSVSTDKKKVDYEQELLDFSNDNYSERTNSADQLSDRKININNSTIEELILLPGIGEKTAEHIVDFRNKNGKFRSIDDLIKVPGIGRKKLDRIKKHIIIE
ncbi:hypothetical protein MNBD_IGNAVI01-1698 [hydrothermal vent metagenome]|uniref:Helix-hairpin-helix DNA-binding motif class 1 domain-containing protein n=1 Tax=hydrothermal vent metagenome TaxID=652676 RepID=A0A3B1BMQ0_9ZZZZ